MEKQGLRRPLIWAVCHKILIFLNKTELFSHTLTIKHTLVQK